MSMRPVADSPENSPPASTLISVGGTRMKPKYFCRALVESDLARIGWTVFLRLKPSTMVIECKLPWMSAIFMFIRSSRTFFPAKGRGLADFNLLNAGLAKAPFQCAAKSHHRKNPANSHANAALRSEAKSRGKNILLIPVLIPGLIPVLIPGLAGIIPGD